MKPISEEIRAGIIAAKERKEPAVSIRKWFGVSDRTISRIWNAYKKTGSYLPLPYTGRRSAIPPQTDAAIRDAIKRTPDITLQGLIDGLSLDLTESGLWRRLSKMGLSYKKRRSAPTGRTART
jgi:transposase